MDIKKSKPSVPHLDESLENNEDIVGNELPLNLKETIAKNREIIEKNREVLKKK